jgi:hypothetical protein
VFPSFFVVRRSARKGKNKREDVKLVEEEEVYNIDEGWKIELDSTEKVRKSLLLLLLV